MKDAILMGLFKALLFSPTLSVTRWLEQMGSGCYDDKLRIVQNSLSTARHCLLDVLCFLDEDSRITQITFETDCFRFTTHLYGFLAHNAEFSSRSLRFH